MSRDADGYLYYVDRIDDMIVSGGENVFPQMVEEHLADHPDLAEVAVIGTAHERWVEQVTAVVVPNRPGVTAEDSTSGAPSIPTCRACTGPGGSRSSRRCRAPAAASSTDPSCGGSSRDRRHEAQRSWRAGGRCSDTKRSELARRRPWQRRHLRGRRRRRLADDQPARRTQRAEQGRARRAVGGHAPIRRRRLRRGPRPHRRRREGVLRGRRPQGDGRDRAGDPAAGLPAAVRAQHRGRETDHRRGQRRRLRGRLPARPAVRPRGGRRARTLRGVGGEGGPRVAVGGAAVVAGPAAGGAGDPADRRPPRRGPGPRGRAGQPRGPGRRPARAHPGARRADRGQRAALGARGEAHRLPVGRALRCAEAYERAEEIWAPVYRSADAQEGPAAFRDKRTPVWTGR